MPSTKVWKYESGDEIDKIYEVPSEKGEQSITSHFGCMETGLLHGCFLPFRGSKSNRDSKYHIEINWEVFGHWCEKKVFLDIRDTQIPSVLGRITLYWMKKIDAQSILGTRRDWLISLCVGKVYRTIGEI